MTVIDYINGNSPLSEMVRSVFMHMRLYYPWNKYSMWKQRNEKEVPQGMVEARKFFEANQLRIDYICSFLADEKSRDTFRKLVHMRQYYEPSDIPQYNYFDQYFPRDIIHFDANEVFIDGGGSFKQDSTGMYSQFVKENTGLTIPLKKMDNLS